MRLTEVEHTRLQRLAEFHELTPAAYVRMLLKKEEENVFAPRETASIRSGKKR